MLKALELFGFKSFADRTRLEFPSGITVIVGPNGSGKSNIVDAIKWVLGEQSAKSLRGQGMADVIFKGAGSGGRKAMNTAEATIIFDNSDKRWPIDAPEIHVTRRIYRSGEGEYLVNRQPYRLRDIRDLFSGSGIGSDAYSLIEQGKVDFLLRASPQDRRSIFEEAAGISRFKAKKVAALRRLERVDQNLLRLLDIAEEVQNRLGTVKVQANKARRYQEYTTRLKDLRTHIALVDWQHLSEKLEAAESDLADLERQAAGASGRAEAVEARGLELDVAAGEAAETIRSCEGRLARNREQIARRESTIDHERRSCRELQEEIAAHRRRVASMGHRAGGLNARLSKTACAVQEAESTHQRLGECLAEHENGFGELTTKIDHLRSEHETRRTEHMDQVRAAASLGNQISALQSQLTTAITHEERCRRRLAELDELRHSQAERLRELGRQEQQLDEKVQTQSTAHKTAEEYLADGRRHLADQQHQSAQLEGRRTGTRERVGVLEELENRLEGISPGVKEVLQRARQEADGPFRDVRGLVADLLQTNHETAPLVDVALGERSQHLVVSGNRVLDVFQSESCGELSGRVGFVRLDTESTHDDAMRVDLQGQAGVIGRADRFVQAASQYTPLMNRLLGDTWFVEKLSHAVALSQSLGRGQRFVTLAGQLLERDGTLLVGPQHHSSGLISRRSELRILYQQISTLNEQIEEASRRTRQLEQAIAEQDRHLRGLAQDHTRAITSLSEYRANRQTAQDRQEQLAKQYATLQSERRAAVAQRGEADQKLDHSRGELASAEALLAEMETNLRREAERIDQLELVRRRYNQHATAAKVDQAKSEQRLESLRARMSQIEADQKECDRALSEAGGQLDQCIERHQESERAVLRASSEVAELYLHKEAFAAEAARTIDRRQALIGERTDLTEEARKLHALRRKLAEEQHNKDLAAGEFRHQRNTLSERVREDYGIKLAELRDQPSQEEARQREEVTAEIEALRRKITNIGAVNLDALAEMDQLQQRHTALTGQHQDLVDAKQSLEKIIQKINTDSRRMFGETMDAIRKNFQVMFRKSFGGGHADIVLEGDGDLLECGIDIVATPPGKQSLNLSLLSGGERALTAVTLLLAIFQFRPSPFCVLDEVDGPLDEANIARFLSVLKEFLHWTKFVVVTHSKKTMTAASTLYGVTMQESGVSKRVSVQFEDVSENGQIRDSALNRRDEGAGESDEPRAA